MREVACLVALPVQLARTLRLTAVTSARRHSFSAAPVSSAVRSRCGSQRAGWHVDVTGREAANMPADLRAAASSSCEPTATTRPRSQSAFGSGADLLVDCVMYTAEDARRLLPLARNATSTVMISSKAVYVDAAGNHSNSDDPPRYDGPIRETQPTLAPLDIDYRSREGYGANKVAAEQVMLDSGLPVSILRPSKIHGRGAARPREWMFVKRVLDRRPAVILAHRGAGVDHTTAAVNIAALVEVVADEPGARILNSADPDAPTESRSPARSRMRSRYDWQEVLLDGDASETSASTRGTARHPIVLDTSAALALGYRPVGDYAATVVDTVDWLVESARGGPDAAKLPVDDDEFFAELFDYAAEDRFLAPALRPCSLHAAPSSTSAPGPPAIVWKTTQ